MRTIPAGEFKARCLAIMDEVQARGETVVVTKRGKPVVRIAPLDAVAGTEASGSSIFGFMRGKAIIEGDIVGPILPEEEWDHLRPEFDPFPTK